MNPVASCHHTKLSQYYRLYPLCEYYTLMTDFVYNWMFLPPNSLGLFYPSSRLPPLWRPPVWPHLLARRALLAGCFKDMLHTVEGSGYPSTRVARLSSPTALNLPPASGQLTPPATPTCQPRPGPASLETSGSPLG